MVFIHDEGSVFDAPVDQVWEFLSAGDAHSDAHRHRNVHRQLLSDNSGRYSWDQPFDGVWVRFTMQWTLFPPVGIAYEVPEGPFAGSRFFLYYTPKRNHTSVSVVGEFVSPTIPQDQLAAAVDRFFSTEFDQDREAIRARAAGKATEVGNPP